MLSYEVETAVADLRREIDTVRSEIASARHELDMFKSQDFSAERRHLQQQIDDLRREVVELRETHNGHNHHGAVIAEADF